MPRPFSQKHRTKRKASGRSHSAPSHNDTNGKLSSCPIVGIGGSAGGFEAVMELLRNLRAKNGVAFVIVQHLDPHHPSRLAHLLSKVTEMRVIEIAGTLPVEPDTVYVQPPDKCVVVKNGALVPVRRTKRLNLTIDHFFESLAEARGSRAIGVILSGSGNDGTAGLRAIKAAGGLTFAQSSESAKFDAMPRSAIRSGFVDAILSPAEIAREVRRIASHPYLRRLANGDHEREAPNRAEDDLNRIFLSLKKHTGVDFTAYKQTTLERRIQRRMTLHRMEKVGQYARFLRDNKKEIQDLFSDLLINVTQFFRDEPVFRALKKRYLPALIKRKKGKELRLWVPGCATGEEVYSLAICILEALGPRAARTSVQIFGTDLSEATIDHARSGIYSTAIEKHVSRARLKKFFTKRDGSYQINSEVRGICTFARQNITADPPFSRLDLISCRNLLIYLGPQLQKRCIPQFHYALNPAGYLVLGPSESVGMHDKLFEVIDRKNRIYVKKNVPTPPLAIVPVESLEFLQARAKSSPADDPNLNERLLEIADRIMLSVYAPAAVITDGDLEVQQRRGRVDDYLEQATAPGMTNLLQLARPSLAADLRQIVRQAIKEGKPTRKERALVKSGGKTREVNIEVLPFKIDASERFWLLVIFNETTKGTRPIKLPPVLGKLASEREITDVRRELTVSKLSGKEIDSRNEDLQLINEELETAKEELQSTNEELTTLNDELSNRNLEMMQLTSDLDNLLASVQFPIVMVDRTLTLRRATPAAREAFNIRQTDIGRPLCELRPNIDIRDLDKILHHVIKTLETCERKVRNAAGQEYSLRVRPYQTIDGKIDGAVIALVDIDRKKKRHARKASKKGL